MFLQKNMPFPQQSQAIKTHKDTVFDRPEFSTGEDNSPLKKSYTPRGRPHPLGSPRVPPPPQKIVVFQVRSAIKWIKIGRSSMILRPQRENDL